MVCCGMYAFKRGGGTCSPARILHLGQLTRKQQRTGTWWEHVDIVLAQLFACLFAAARDMPMPWFQQPRDCLQLSAMGFGISTRYLVHGTVRDVMVA